MRKFGLILALLVPTIAGADAASDRAAATQLLVNNLMGLGGTAARAETIALCFVDRMTDAQAAGFVAARNAQDREAVLSGVEDKDGASACVQQAMTG